MDGGLATVFRRGRDLLGPLRERAPAAARALDLLERDLLPRSAGGDAYLVAGIVGPNNAGKSALFNALVGRAAEPLGAARRRDPPPGRRRASGAARAPARRADAGPLPPVPARRRSGGVARRRSSRRRIPPSLLVAAEPSCRRSHAHRHARLRQHPGRQPPRQRVAARGRRSGHRGGDAPLVPEPRGGPLSRALVRARAAVDAGVQRGDRRGRGARARGQAGRRRRHPAAGGVLGAAQSRGAARARGARPAGAVARRVGPASQSLRDLLFDLGRSPRSKARPSPPP